MNGHSCYNLVSAKTPAPVFEVQPYKTGLNFDHEKKVDSDIIVSRSLEACVLDCSKIYEEDCKTVSKKVFTDSTTKNILQKVDIQQGWKENICFSCKV